MFQKGVCGCVRVYQCKSVFSVFGTLLIRIRTPSDRSDVCYPLHYLMSLHTYTSKGTHTQPLTKRSHMKYTITYADVCEDTHKSRAYLRSPGAGSVKFSPASMLPTILCAREAMTSVTPLDSLSSADCLTTGAY